MVITAKVYNTHNNLLVKKKKDKIESGGEAKETETLWLWFHVDWRHYNFHNASSPTPMIEIHIKLKGITKATQPTNG